MKTKTVKHAFASAITTGVTKYSAGATPAELVALAVLPASPFHTGAHDARTGIEMSYDAAQLIADFDARGRKLPYDIEHNTQRAGADSRARGWIHSLTNAEMEPTAGFEPGVLYAWVELTPLGAQEFADKLFGYTSAVVLGSWLTETSCRITRVKSLAATNNPATEMPMNFTAEDEADDAGYTACEQLTPEQTDMLNKLLEKLGLTPETAEADVLYAVDALLAPSTVETALTTAGFTAQDLSGGSLVRIDALTAAASQVTLLAAQVGTLQTELTTAQTALATFQAEQTESAAVAAVDAAIKAGKYVPAIRDELLEDARENLARFTVKTAKSPVLAAFATSVATHGMSDESHGLSAEQLAFCKQNRIGPAIYAKNLRASA